MQEENIHSGETRRENFGEKTMKDLCHTLQIVNGHTKRIEDDEGDDDERKAPVPHLSWSLLSPNNTS